MTRHRIPHYHGCRQSRIQQAIRDADVTVTESCGPIIAAYGPARRRLAGYFYLPARTICIDGTLPAVIRQTVLAHELMHALHDDNGHQPERVEAVRDEEAARLLVTPEEYAAVEHLFDTPTPGLLAKELDTTTSMILAWQRAWARRQTAA